MDIDALKTAAKQFLLDSFGGSLNPELGQIVQDYKARTFDKFAADPAGYANAAIRQGFGMDASDALAQRRMLGLDAVAGSDQTNSALKQQTQANGLNTALAGMTTSKGLPNEKLYTGVGEGSDLTTGFRWFSPDKKIAEGYANKRQGGKVEDFNIAVKNSFDASHDTRRLTAGEFFNSAAKQSSSAKLNDENALALRKQFVDYFGKDTKDITEFWADPKAKTATRDLLESLGFDSVKILEDGAPTLGVLRVK